MLFTDVMYDHKPERVIIEDLPDGMSHIMLADEIREVTDEESSTYYMADEAYMEIATDERPTKEEIEADFYAWYGTACEWTRQEAQSAEEQLVELVVNLAHKYGDLEDELAAAKILLGVE